MKTWEWGMEVIFEFFQILVEFVELYLLNKFHTYILIFHFRLLNTGLSGYSEPLFARHVPYIEAVHYTRIAR